MDGINYSNHPCEDRMITQIRAMGSTRARLFALNVIKIVEQFVLRFFDVSAVWVCIHVSAPHSSGNTFLCLPDYLHAP